MAKQKTAAPNATSADVHLLPWERGTETVDADASLSQAAESIMDQPEPDEPVGDEPDAVEAEAQAEAEADTAEPEAEADAASDEADPIIDLGDEKVTRSELKKRGLREADYTRKTQEAAERRKQAEAIEAEARAKRDAYAAQLETLGTLIQQSLPKKPDAALRDEDPQEYLLQKALYDEAIENLNKVNAQKAQIAAEQSAEMEKARAEAFQSEKQKLIEKVPEWKDPKAMESAASKMYAYAEQTYGWTSKDLDTVPDHRPFLLLWKAMQYDEMVAKGKQKVEQITPTLRPGGRTTPDVAARKTSSKEAENLAKRARRTGRAEDAAALIERMLG